MIELKRGLNYIIGNKAYTPDELIRDMRKLCLCLLFIGIPVSFSGGFIVSKKLFPPMPSVSVLPTEVPGQCRDENASVD